MKKTLVSLAAASLIVTSAMAADKGIDIVTTGQAVVYYETHSSDAAGDKGLFDQDNSVANVGLQLNLDADLGNNFTFGSQVSYLGAAGLEKNVVYNVKQSAGSAVNGATTDELALTKIFVAKKVGNTTVKLGRQELPKSLSPLAFTEGWNVLKNTFDAVLAVNSDIPDTTLVGAYVSGGTGHTLGSTADLTAQGFDVTGGAYMLTAQNKSIPMTTVTASYYHMTQIDTDSNVSVEDAAGNNADAIWLDAKIAGKDLPLGLKVGLQYGSISPDLTSIPTAKDTSAMGAKVSLAPMDALTVALAYTSVDDGTVAVRNTGGIKTPLFTQMVYNQDYICSDADTILGKVAYNTGDYGKVIVQYGATTDESTAGTNDYNELDVIYKIKSGGVQYFAAYINRDFEAANTDDDKIRIWARLNF